MHWHTGCGSLAHTKPAPTKLTAEGTATLRQDALATTVGENDPSRGK
jgi:hypothetical protein